MWFSRNHEENERELRETLLRQAVEQACLTGNLAKERKNQAVEALLRRLRTSSSVDVKKTSPSCSRIERPLQRT
jgi:hypothetical protein